jgi:hypothetical protein
LDFRSFLQSQATVLAIFLWQNGPIRMGRLKPAKPAKRVTQGSSMMTNVRTFLVALTSAGLLASTSIAQELSTDEQNAVRGKVQTAVSLAEIAEAEGDAEAMLVAVRMLASVGPVAKRGESGDSPVLYSVGDLATAAEALGADAAAVEALRASATSSTTETQPTYCYWDYTCNTFDCAWVYVC